MPGKELSNLIKEIKQYYITLGNMECPAFDNEKVYFNHYGFDHLIAKQRKFRTPDEIRKRFDLLHYAIHVIKFTKAIFSEEKRIKGQSIAYFWTIKHRVDNRIIRVILRRLNDGTLHFFSIMEENTKPPGGGL